MSLIPDVGRKSLKNRIIIIAIYITLTMLGATMVVPFLITLTSSMSNDFDYHRFSPLPRYLWSQEDRFVKCLVPYFNKTRMWPQQLAAVAPDTPKHWTSWSIIGQDTDNIKTFARTYLDQANPIIAADYAEFMDTYPLEDCFVYAPQNKLINFLINQFTEKYKGLHPEEDLSEKELKSKALELLGSEWKMPLTSFYNIDCVTEMNAPLDFQTWFPPSNPKYLSYNDYKIAADAHLFTPGVKSTWFDYLDEKQYAGPKPFPVLRDADPKLRALWLDFKKVQAPVSPLIPHAMRVVWIKFLHSEEITNANDGVKITIDVYNQLAGTNYSSLERTPFPIPSSFKPGIQKLWKKFLQERFPLRQVSITPTPELQRRYQNFVKETLRTLKITNKMLGTSYQDWSELNISPVFPKRITQYDENRLALWKNFVKMMPVSEKQVNSSEISFQNYLLKKYGSLENINRTYGWNLKHIEEAFPPVMQAYAQMFLKNEYSMTFAPIFDNYKLILNYLLFNGNAFLVTLALVMLTMAFTLTINPLAAYALSRFNLRGRNQILIFMLATMAFPAMVSAIPAYLLMRDLGLLNTFWALVLPGAANGMAIFILKGFFDSLPMELFEAATIDGADEMQIFRIIAMPMVKPILAINCLNAFIAAYNGWEWALIICQDKSMWTIAVWMYQASSWWGGMPWVVSAGFVIVSIPTMIIFISCQKIILKGIIIPSMK